MKKAVFEKLPVHEKLELLYEEWDNLQNALEFAQENCKDIEVLRIKEVIQAHEKQIEGLKNLE